MHKYHMMAFTYLYVFIKKKKKKSLKNKKIKKLKKTKNI